jgi:predicted XRE-type DNA-binding protein
MIDILNKYLPMWVLEAKLFPPEEKKNAADFRECWIARNTNSFTLQIMKNRQKFYLRREIISRYKEVDLKKVRVFQCPEHPLCLNPFHFPLKTIGQKRQKLEKQKQQSGKLSQKEIEEIINLLFTTELSQREIGERFGIKQQSVSYILKRFNFKESYSRQKSGKILLN